MKIVKTLVVTCCTAALLMGYSLSAADQPDKHKGCCPATVEGEKSCAHECCKKAAEEGKICKKCHKEHKKDENK